MTTKDLAVNFVSQFNKPFDLGTISALIGRSPRSVKPVLAELLTAKQIRLVDPEQGIYVRDNRYFARVCYHQKSYWRFDPQDALGLLDMLESGNNKSIRSIAKVVNKSHQWVYVYLEALASLGCIDLVKDRYIVISRDHVKDIGAQIKVGILGTMREQCRKEKRAIQEAEKERKRQISDAKKREQELKEKLTQDEIAKKEAFMKVWNNYLLSGKAVYLSFDEYVKSQTSSR
jgi:predicted transcriptional regulator